MTSEVMLPDAAEAVAAEETERAEVVLTTATSLVISTPDDFESAASFRSEIRSQLKELDAKEKEITRPLNETLRRVRDLFRPAKEKREAAVTAIDNGLRGYQRAIEAQQREEARLAEQARRKQIEQEAIDRAAELEADGDVDRAQRVMESAFVPETAPPPVEISTATAKAQGLATRRTWKWRVTDPTAIPRAYMMVNEKMLDAKARTEKGNAQVPGIEFFEDFNFASTGR